MDKYMKKSDVIAYIRKEAKEAQSAFEELGGESGIIAEAFEDLANELEDFPATDVAPVRHGRWEYIPQTLNTLSRFRCPFCGWWTLDPSVGDVYNYCPHCGARMDGAENE